MNICFIANYSKTFFFEKIALNLQNNFGTEVFWIVTNLKLYNHLNSNFKKSNILYLSKEKYKNIENSPIGEFKLNDIAYNDRAIRYDLMNGINFLKNIQIDIYNFIDLNKIRLIFGEVTWAHELVIHRLVKSRKELKCKYLNPHLIRIPDNRFAFFKDELQSKILGIKPQLELTEYKDSYFDVIKPDYFILANAKIQSSKSFSFIIMRIKRYITSENLDSNDITLLSKKSFHRFFLPTKSVVNTVLYRFMKKEKIESIKDKPFVLLTLHKQPEASIDVVGRYYENQYINIINVWKQLPNNWILVVKEHPNAIGDRSYFFYKKLKSLRNLVLIDEKINTETLIKKSELVVTVSGTSAYEAALTNKKALVMSDVFFGLSSIKKVTLEEFKYSNNIFDLTSDIPNSSINDEDIKRYIYTNSFAGIISDPSNEKCMSIRNIDNVSKAFYHVISNIEWKE